jgi:cob(I)alamin adenosyltransferase
MVKLDRITTRGGDGGETSLGDGTRLRKDATRIACLGALDEANAALGLLRSCAPKDAWADARVDPVLAHMQNDLFDIGADLAVPGIADDRLRVTEAYSLWLEDSLALFNAGLAPLHSFVLPGGTLAASHAHLARTIVRRAEREVVSLAALEPLNPHLVRALNRMSDLLFVLSRVLNDNGKADVLWVPGGAS